MQKEIQIPRVTVIWRYLGILAITILILIAFGSNVMAADAVDLRMTCGGQNDTIRPDVPTTFDIHIENSFELYGIDIGFQIWSPDGATWQWDAQPNGHGVTKACVTLVPFSRMDPNGDGYAYDVFDMTGLMVYERNMDETGRDTIGMEGVSVMRYMTIGPLEHMLSLHFIPGDPIGNPVQTLCIDSCFIPPSGAFVFRNVVGAAIPPAILWPSGGRCWPVKKRAPANGDVNCDGDINVGDAVYLINWIFRGGPPPC
jgi:hypothetical protein